MSAAYDLLVRVRHLRQIDADRQPEEAIDAPHPVGVALCEVVVDRDHVHALARQRIQVGGQRGDEGLAFPRAHFRDLAVVQCNAADELHVEVTHVERALARFANDRERLGQHLVERGAFGDARLQLFRLLAQRIVRKGGNGRLEDVDFTHLLRILLQEPFIAAAENTGEDIDHRGEGSLAPDGQKARGEDRLTPRMAAGSGSGSVSAWLAGIAPDSTTRPSTARRSQQNAPRPRRGLRVRPIWPPACSIATRATAYWHGRSARILS